MVDRALSEEATGRKPGVAGADDNRRYALNGSAPPRPQAPL